MEQVKVNVHALDGKIVRKLTLPVKLPGVLLWHCPNDPQGSEPRVFVINAASVHRELPREQLAREGSVVSYYEVQAGSLVNYPERSE